MTRASVNYRTPVKAYAIGAHEERKEKGDRKII